MAFRFLRPCTHYVFVKCRHGSRKASAEKQLKRFVLLIKRGEVEEGDNKTKTKQTKGSLFHSQGKCFLKKSA